MYNMYNMSNMYNMYNMYNVYNVYNWYGMYMQGNVCTLCTKMCMHIYIYIISKICKNLQYDIVIVCIKRMICTVCQIRIICIMDTHVYIYIYSRYIIEILP